MVSEDLTSLGATFARARRTSTERDRHVQRVRIVLAAALGALILGTPNAHAQARVGSDSATRLDRFGRDFAYGTAEGLAFSGLDQLRTDPVEWGKGWQGYEKRAASNLGEFYIQEVVTEGLAAIMNRPLDYKPCKCREFGDRLVAAVRGAVTDQMPDGSHALAIPRLVGAFAGSFAQATWRPATGSSRTRIAIGNGVTSIAIGSLINLYHEMRR